MLIAIPSKSRPYKSKSKELLKTGKLFVPASEFDLYNRIYPNDVIAVPNEVRGITATRNWILRENIGQDVVFVDDDLKRCAYLLREGESGALMFKKKYVQMTEQEIMREFEKLFELTKSMGWKIWGANTESSKWSSHEEKPFIFLSYITASCMGIVNDGTMFFDEDFKVKEDYEIGLRHIKMFSGVVKARHFYWENKHWTTEGGCKDYRNDVMERDCINRLIKKYPQFVKKVERNNSAYCIKLFFD